MYDVFLGGTCGKNDWRDGFISRLVVRGVPRDVLFNPVLAPGTWNEEAQRLEDQVKKTAGICLFYLGNPHMEETLPYSMYSLVQLVDSCFNAGRVTRALLDTASLSEDAARAFKKSLADLETISPGMLTQDWEGFVKEIARLWGDNRNLLAFLGGTSGNNPWRQRLLWDLEVRGVDTKRFFDPVVPPGTWNKGVQKLEDQVRGFCDHEFFFFGSPMENRGENSQFSAYSVVEAYMGLYRDRRRTMICIDYPDLGGHAFVSMTKFQQDAQAKFPAAGIFSDLVQAENFIVSKFAVANR